jgi:hypothetical protein
VHSALGCLDQSLYNWSSGLLYCFVKLHGLCSGHRPVFTIGQWLRLRVCDITAAFEPREKKIHNLGHRLPLDDDLS